MMRRMLAAAVATLTAGCASATLPRRPAAVPSRPAAAPARTRPDVYAYDRPGMLSPVVREFPARVYVPDSRSDDVIVFDQRTFERVGRFRVGRTPQHVVPSWDIKTLWVNDNASNDLVPIDPRTGRPGRPVPVQDPYNLYFTPDGRFAIVMAERLQRIDFLNAATGAFFLTACEFSGDLLKIDTRRQKVIGTLRLGRHSMPQDVKLAPDGSVFYVADMMADGVWIIDAATFRKIGFVRTGRGAHGLYPDRDSRYLYVSNRGEGSISLLSFADRRVARTWRLPGGGSPDMGGLSADGKVLWLSGRYDDVVYAISTTDGRLLRKLAVGHGPHGLCVYPQPGRYSLGHTGVLR
jgi:DNA-binding beta-propeller fold protein YncE